MTGSKSDIINQLQQEILALQGFKSNCKSPEVDIGLGPIWNAFPGKCFPLAAIHELVFHKPEQAAATTGFVAGILGSLMKKGGIAIWISPSKMLFPPALQSFGLQPDKILFIEVRKEKEILWVMEEALHCEGLIAVIGEVQDFTFTTSRRFQLAVEQSRVTGFILRNKPRNLNTTASVTRWKISPLASGFETPMPGVGFPRWNVELLKVRNGKPGSWQIECRAGQFKHLVKRTVPARQLLSKVV